MTPTRVLVAAWPAEVVWTFLDHVYAVTMKVDEKDDQQHPQWYVVMLLVGFGAMLRHAWREACGEGFMVHIPEQEV